MKKNYKFTLPQNKEVKSTNVRVENGEVVIDVEFKEKFDPKDGDFLILKDSIFIYNPNNNTILNGYYAGVSNDGSITISNEICCGFGLRGEKMRYATQEEKSDFLARLEKECGKKWNEERKCLEDIYIPKFGDIVKVISSEPTECRRNYMIVIWPEKLIDINSYNRHCFNIANLDYDGDLNYKCSNGTRGKLSLVIASESEKKELFDNLAEVGKRWDPETKQLEDIRWIPNIGCVFYYVDVNGEVKSATRTRFINFLEEFPNCFRTPEATQKVADQIKEIFKNSKAE